MPTDTATIRDRIVDAFLARLATTPLGDIDLADVARDADVALADLRLAFDSRLAILAAFSRRIDAEVLRGDDPAMAGEPGRDRLFDVLMRRLDVLTPYKDAVRMLDRSLRREPMLALALNGLATRSMAFMLTAAGIPTGGPLGRLRVQGLAIAWSRILPVWLDDTDPGLARSMVAVDKELQRGQRAMGMAGRVCDALGRLDDRLSSRRRHRPETPAPAAEGAAGEGI